MPASNRKGIRGLWKGKSGASTQPFSVWEALGEEYWSAAAPAVPDEQYTAALSHYREKCAHWHRAGQPEEGPTHEAYWAAELAFRTVLIERLHEGKRTALCFSGGGIRSATFGLGVLQGLATHSCVKNSAAEPVLLGEVDYLSTVSGGGYLGAWFSSWAYRHEQGVAGVIRELASAPQTDWEPEPQPLRYLRRFASYLNPQLGAFSADTWTLAATVLRNILLNWLVLLPLLAAALVLPRLLYALVWVYPASPPTYMLPAAAVLVAASVAYMVLDLPSAGNSRFGQRRFLLFGLTPILLAAIGFTLYWAWQGDLKLAPNLLGFVSYGIAVVAAGTIAGILLARWKSQPASAQWILECAVFAVITGASGGLFSYWLTRVFTDPIGGDIYSERIYAWLSLPALLGVFAVSQSLLVAMSSSITSDEDREWWSRAMAWMFIAMVCCLGFNGIVLMATDPKLMASLPDLRWQSLSTAVAGLIASRIGFSPKTSGTQERPEPGLSASVAQAAWKLAPKLILPVFLGLLVVVIATFNEHASQRVSVWLGRPAEPSVVVELALMGLLAVPALLLARIINVNKFSLHAMYRARLIRTFLGASNTKRKPNPFTGFDPNDNVAMVDLPAKPLHVVNGTLNLVKGEKLAWQQRKAESFTVTRYRAGSCRVGYQASSEYFGNATLGGSITVSGAAANPNMGYASSPLLSIVMMLFNARLGAWAANPGAPGRGCWNKTGPTYSVRPFLDEAFGLTSDQNAWVNLSDGGHFENLGLYEMVLRRCRTIIVVDGSADPEFRFDDLGNAIRKIRVDMGISIDFPNFSITGKAAPDSRHAAVGTINYAAVDGQGAEPGTLLYLKSSLTGTEPRDVRNYADQNPQFPHQSTADQWFDETQFESYRRLGLHVIEQIFQGQPGIATIEEFKKKVKDYCATRQRAAAI